jgi:TrmH family RNA methyltransferase
MKIVTSAQNETYKSLLKLTRKKGRDEQNAFLLDGEKMLAEAAKFGAEIATVVFRGSEAASAVYRAVDIPPEAYAVALREDLFDKLTDEPSPNRVMAALAKPHYEVEAMRGGVVVVLDRLQDSGNVGTIIRTAEAAGACGVIAVKGTADIWSQKVCRATAGAIIRLPLFTVDSAADALKLLARLNIRPVACNMSGESMYADGVIDGSVAFIIGNEGAGVSREFTDASPRTVGIPMSGESESLNAAVAAALLLYEKKRIG